MSKKYIIISLLVFAYTIVLGHNIIPHGHFDEVFSLDHHEGNSSQDHSDHSDHDNSHDHDYPFSHNVTLHITFEKQNIYSYHPVKSEIKKIPVGAVCQLKRPVKLFKLYDNNKFEFENFVFRPQNEINTSLYNRPPPEFLS